MWGDRERIEEEVTTQQILQGDKRSWKLITVHGNKYTGTVGKAGPRFYDPKNREFLSEMLIHATKSPSF